MLTFDKAFFFLPSTECTLWISSANRGGAEEAVVHRSGRGQSWGGGVRVGGDHGDLQCRLVYTQALCACPRARVCVFIQITLLQRGARPNREEALKPQAGKGGGGRVEEGWRRLLNT